MEHRTLTPPSRVDRFRLWIRTLAGNVFTAPYLPLALTFVFVVTVMTNLAIILMSQPLSYWSSGKAGAGIDIFGGPLSYGPAGLIGLTIVYLILGSLLLGFVNYRWSLVGWLTVEFVHFYFIQEILSTCRLSRWLASVEVVCDAVNYGIFWMFAAIFIGILLALSFQPAQLPIANKKIERGIFSFAGLLVTVWMFIMAGGVIWSAQKPSFGWVLVEVDKKPGPLQDGEAAFDTKRDKLVVFGGASGYIGDNQWAYKNDTWEWDGNTWMQISSDANPPARLDHAIAFDENRGVMVLFGGLGDDGRLSDTWEWNGKIWTEKHPETHPSGRSGHEMVYDPVRKRVVMYGGYSDPAFYNDAWEWDGSEWKWLDLTGEAPVASVFALANNTEEGYILGLLSGTPGGSWEWRENTWTRLYPPIEPSNRASTTMVYDPQEKVFFTFGGITGSETVSDTWTFDGTEWNLYTKGGIHPSARSDMTMWYDPFRKHVMLFGGRDDSNVYNDMWEFIPPQE